MRQLGFEEMRAFSTRSHGRTFEQIIADTIPGCASVTATDIATDKTGTDYVATLRRGSEVNIDLKVRDRAGQYWHDGQEELALETWSVIPSGNHSGKAGWTLDESKTTHYTLHVFHPDDTDRVFLLPFQLLRKAFRQNIEEWKGKFKTARQSSGSWCSECVFVPAPVVLDAIHAAMVHVVHP